MLLGGLHRPARRGVRAGLGIDNVTATDGLAVGRPSGFVGKAMQRLVDGYYTVSDEELYSLLVLLERAGHVRLEPSALAGLPHRQDPERAAGLSGVDGPLTSNHGARHSSGMGHGRQHGAPPTKWMPGWPQAADCWRKKPETRFRHGPGAPTLARLGSVGKSHAYGK